MTTTSTDRIEKSVVLQAPRTRVWRALTSSAEFGSWFGATFTETFAEGVVLRAQVTNPGYEHLTMEIRIVSMEPERYFAFRWHPDAVDLTKDYAHEPTTLVEFTLEDAPGGTKLTIVESGFDAIPPGRRDEAFRSNDQGWTEQMQNIATHVTGA
jgi:uncharacterized protein YndB with AHSA1/START domain